MIINVFSLNEANKLIKFDKEYQKNWISIRDVDVPQIYENFCLVEHVCPIEFDDVTKHWVKYKCLHPYHKKVGESRDFIYFSEDLARKIFNFADEIFHKNESLNIHCYAGKSRSQAIGYVLNNYYNLILDQNLNDFKSNLEHNNLNFRGNPEVIQIMNKVLLEKMNKII